MLVERAGQISNFQKEKYFNVELDCDGIPAIKPKIFDPDKAEQLRSRCQGSEASISAVKETEKKVKAPKLYDLTTLQREANRIYGMTAKQTLDTAQSLYEKKLITYPRTDSQYLTEDMEQTARNVVRQIYEKYQLTGPFDQPEQPDVKKVMNNSKVTDHHAIIPTMELTNRGGDMQAYYVDRFGFAELPEFAAQREKILDIVPEIENVDYENDLTCISFYAAECAEFPVMGEVHYDLTLPEALEAYEKIPSERMHGLKCVGFDLKDGSDYEGMQSLMIEGKIQKEFLNSIPGFRENSYVQNAISRVEKYLEERHLNVENPLKSNKKVDNEKNISEEKNEKELNIQMKPIPKKKRGEMSL